MAEWQPVREDLAWAAGIFDGEGHVSGRWRGPGETRKRPNPYWSMTLSVTQNDAEMLERFARIVGVGHVDGPYFARGASYNKGNRQEHYEYRTGRFEHVQHIAAVLWPWLGTIKRKQFAQALTQAEYTRRAYVKSGRYSRREVAPIHGR